MLNRYTVKSRIEGSNPSVSARYAGFLAGFRQKLGVVYLLTHTLTPVPPVRCERGNVWS